MTQNIVVDRSKTIHDYPEFDGKTYYHDFDYLRLKGQNKRVFNLMVDGIWRTLDEIADYTHDPPASVSARLRDLRKPKFGGFVIEMRPRGLRKNGLFEYRLTGLKGMRR